MLLIRLLSSALAWLGRQGTRAIAAIVFVAIALPPLDALLKPFVTEAIFLLLAIAFLRVDLGVLRGYLKRPALVLLATLWTSVVLPSLVGAGCLLVGLDARSPGLFLGVMLQALASPMMAAPAFAALMGLDATLVLSALVTSTALTPLTAPVFAYAFIGPALTLSPLALGLKLLTILAGSLLVAVAIRRFVGVAVIRRYAPQIDGLNILLFFIFVAAVMENVAAQFLVAPGELIGLLVLAFAVFFAILAVTACVFAKAGPDRSLALGLMASQRNMGPMLAVTGGVLPEQAWLYFALAQFPIYLSPFLLDPLARRWRTSPQRQPT